MSTNSNPLIVYVDVDETLVRNFGSKRIPMPNGIRHVRTLYEQGAELYCWSSGGAAYARESAEECGISDCFQAFLPKPQLMLDDQHVSGWRRFIHIHPVACGGESVAMYLAAIDDPTRLRKP